MVIKKAVVPDLGSRGPVWRPVREDVARSSVRVMDLTIGIFCSVSHCREPSFLGTIKKTS